MVGEALFRRAFRAFNEKRYADAQTLLAENIRLVPLATVWYAEGRAEYWQGRSHEEAKNLLFAVAAYEQAVRRYPLSVYAWLAFQRLDVIAPRTRATLLRELRPKALPKEPQLGHLTAPELAASADPGFGRALELARMGLANEAQRELARFSSARLRAGAASETIADLAWLTALVLHRSGLWNASYAYAADRLGDFRRSYPAGAGLGRWQVAYPRAHAALVERESRANGVPVALQWALMREESAFDPRAESSANCLGLCMLKRSTATERLGRPVTREMLWDPVTNVVAGSKQLAWVLRQQDGNAAYAVAAYNAGVGAVGKWRSQVESALPLDEFLENIPYDETRGYTKRVLASYFVYSWLYDDAQPIPPLPGR
jgi:soluble lytic murein transglycosylase